MDETYRTRLVKNNNLIAFSFFNYKDNVMALDILVDVPITFDTLSEDKVVKRFKNMEMYLASLQHLIALKKYSNREQDKEDIILLTKLLEDNGDNT